MKLKCFLAIALVTTASSSAFSMEIVKGKVISQKTWSTINNKSTATFKETTFDQKKLAILFNKHRNDSYVWTYAADHMDDVPEAVTVGDALDISGSSNAFIRNEALSRKQFMIESSVCYSPSRQMMTCQFNSTTLYLDVGGYVSLSQHPEWKGLKFDEVGDAVVSVETQIQDIDENNVTVFSSDDYRFINVAPAKK